MRQLAYVLPICWLIAACALARPPRDPALEATRHRAALATLVVDNRTPENLTIAYRPATTPGPEVIVGRVPARTRTAVAPIPADEPILLRARRPAGAELQLPARSFALDEVWEWVVDADAAFEAPSEAAQ